MVTLPAATAAATAVLIACGIGNVNAAPCNRQSVSLNVDDSAGAAALASILDCSGGDFKVILVGSVQVIQTFIVYDGTSLTIIGEEDENGNSAALESTSDGALFFVSGGGSSLTLRTLEVKGGSGMNGGAIGAENSATVNVFDCAFSDNNGDISGGAIAGTSAHIRIAGTSSFTNNSARSFGGAIFLESSTLDITGDVRFLENAAGGSGGAIGASVGLNATVYGTSLFERNTAQDGGAVYAGGSSQLQVRGVANFTANRATSGGGAIKMMDGSFLNIGDKATFSRNIAGFGGGAVALAGRGLTLVVGGETLFIENTAGSGGGAVSAIEIDDANDDVVDIHGSTTFIRNVAATTHGGAVHVEAIKSFTVAGQTTLLQNSAPVGFGGGIHVITTEYVSLVGVHFEHNTASWGGGLAAFSSGSQFPIEYRNCDFIKNAVTQDGGGIYSIASYDNIEGVRMTGNFAGGSGGALVHSGKIDELKNSTFSANRAGIEGPAVYSLGPISVLHECSFAGNNFHCPAGQYLEEDGEGCRFEAVCARCMANRCPDDPAVAILEETRVPSCEATYEHTTTPQPGGTLATLTLDRGFFRTSAASTEILECYNENACIGGSLVEEYCAEGYTGPYCAICKSGYAAGSLYSCQACTDTSSQIVSAALVITLSILLLIVVWIVKYLVTVVPPHDDRRDTGKHLRPRDEFLAKDLVAMIKILLVVWQIITQFTSVTRTEYMGAYRRFLQVIGVVNFDIGLMLSVSCTMDSDFYARLLVATLGPLVFVAMLATTYSIACAKYRRFSLDEVGVVKIRQRHLSILLLAAFLIYSSVSTTVFETFDCDKLDDGVDYLRADYRLHCTSTKHRIFMAYAVIMIMVYPVGIPCSLGVWLFKHRHALTSMGSEPDSVSCMLNLEGNIRPEKVPTSFSFALRDHSTEHDHVGGTDGAHAGRPDLKRELSSTSTDASLELEPFADLWEPYKPNRYYWEIVEFSRRVLLTGVGVFIFPDSAAQIAVIVLLAGGYGVVFEVLAPYKRSLNAWLYRAGYIVVVLGMYLALLLKIDLSDERWSRQETFSVLLIVVHCMLLVGVFAEGLYVVRETWLRMKQNRTELEGVAGFHDHQRTGRVGKW